MNNINETVAIPGQDAESAQAYFEQKNMMSSNFVQTHFDVNAIANGVLLNEAAWTEIKKDYERQFASGAFGKLIYNLGLGKIFRLIPKATNKESDALSRAKVYTAFGVSSQSGTEYIRLAENEGLVMGTVRNALKTGEPITQARILKLLGAHEMFRELSPEPVAYLQRYDNIMRDGLAKPDDEALMPEAV